MTLILSVISPRWAMQASDRTVTELNAAGEVLGYQDERNKAIFVAEWLTFAYTGHADIGGADTADWFQAQLARNMSRGQSVDAALDEVVQMATQYFRALPPHVVDRQHAFVGVGWTEGDVDARQPFIVCLSNSISNDGAWLRTAQEDFQRYEETLPASPGFSLFVAGAPVRDEAIGYLSARIASHLDGSDDAAPVARMLIKAIREEAQSNRSIGEGVMVNSLPISPGPSTGDVMLVGGMPERDVRTFTYVRQMGRALPRPARGVV